MAPKAASSRKVGGVSGREPASQGCPAGPAGHSSVLRPWLQVTTCPLHAVTSRRSSPGLWDESWASLSPQVLGNTCVTDGEASGGHSATWKVLETGLSADPVPDTYLTWQWFPKAIVMRFLPKLSLSFSLTVNILLYPSWNAAGLSTADYGVLDGILGQKKEC